MRTYRGRFGAGVLVIFLYTNMMQAAENYTPPSSDPQNLHRFQDHIYFSADDGVHGRELWRTTSDGDAELVADITPGSSGSKINKFASFGSILLFRREPEEGGSELWKTDGSAEGTKRITQFNADKQEIFDGIWGITDDGKAYFRVLGETTRFWVTDGTEAGTVPCPLALPDGTPVTLDYAGVVHNDDVYFGGVHSTDSAGLFRYGHDDNNVELVVSLDSPEVEFMRMDENRLLFRGAMSDKGLELMLTDGTSEGTELVYDIAPGPASSFPNQFAVIEGTFSPTAAHPDRFALTPNENARKLVIFSADDGIHGIEPWITDGTRDGTRLLADIYTGAEGSVAYNYKAYGDRVIFQAKSEGTGRELWYTFRPFDTARILADIYPGPTGSEPYSVCPLQENKVVFSALDPTYGEELFFASASSPEARLLRDIYPGPKSSYPYWSVAIHGRVIFAATDPVHGRELWYTDGESEVGLLADIYTDASINPSSSPSQLTPVGDLLYFVCNDLVHGTELWISDGTAAGTHLLKDIFTGPGSSSPQELTPLGDIVYFTAESEDTSTGLWRTDGTAEGTLPVETDARNPLHLAAHNQVLFFTATRAEEGRELWVTGPGRSAELVSDIATGPTSSNPRNLTVFQGMLYFLANDGVHGEELWRSDGTAAGTTMVRDMADIPYEEIYVGSLTPSENSLFLTVGTGSQGMELWRMQKGTNRPALVKDIARWDLLDALSVSAKATLK